MLTLCLSFPRLFFWGCWFVLGGLPVLTIHSQELPPVPQSPGPKTSQNSDSSQNSELPAQDLRLPLAATPPIMTPEIIAEINEIRNRLGGGVASRLEGIFPADEDLATEARKEEPADRPDTSPQDSFRSPLQREFEHQLKLLASGVSQRKPTFLPTVGEDESRQSLSKPALVERLRSAARHLDLAAAELEDVSQFGMADDLRRQAQQMRLKARPTQTR